VNTAAQAEDRPMPGASQAKYPIPIHAKYAAARTQISCDDRRVGQSASPTIATAARYQTICIGQAAALARPNEARNSLSGVCGYGWTGRVPYVTAAAITAAANAIPSAESCECA